MFGLRSNSGRSFGEQHSGRFLAGDSHVHRTSLTISLACLFASTALAQNRVSSPPVADDLVPQADEVFRTQTATWAPETAYKQLGDLLKTAAASRETRKEGLVTAAAHGRAIHLAEAAPDQVRARLLKFFIDNPAAERTLVMCIRAGDKATEVATIFDTLAMNKTANVQRLPALAAAIAVTHDARVRDPQISEVHTSSPGEYFDYFIANAGALAFKLDRTPPELLVYMVNVTAPISDLNWARNRYNNRPRIGQVYFDVAYDYGFLEGTQKKASDRGEYTLENLRKYGGICSDQAYYANQCAKAIGVPAVVVTAPGTTVGHAWIGYLTSGAATTWDFDSGRYPEFQGVAGEIRDPQTGHQITDARVKLTARLAGTAPMDRWRCIALTDAAHAIASENATTALEWLEAAVNACPAMADPWDEVVAISKAGKLTAAARSRWSEAVLRLCGKDSPDFALDVLLPMIRSVDDVQEQSKAWDWAFDHFVRPQGDQTAPRWDLAARIKIAQGAMWENAGDTAAALAAYQLVIDRFSAQGPHGLDAAMHVASIFHKNQRPAMEIAEVFARAWHLAKKPESLSDNFRASTPWYRLGVLYAQALDEAGKKADADHVRKQIKYKASRG